MAQVSTTAQLLPVLLQRSTPVPSVLQRVVPVVQAGAARHVVTPERTAQDPSDAQAWCRYGFRPEVSHCQISGPEAAEKQKRRPGSQVAGAHAEVPP